MVKKTMEDKSDDIFRRNCLSIMDERGITQLELANLTGYRKEHVNAALRGRKTISRNFALKVAAALGMEARNLYQYAAGDVTIPSPVVVAEASGEYGEFVSVPLREATGSMGGGSLETGRTVKYHLQFRRDWLISKASSDRDLFCVKAFGDSMHPTIPDGSLVLVSPARASFSDGKIYYIRHNGQMFVKRMTGKPGAMVVVSDADPTCPAPVVEGDDFEIIGRIIWTAREVD
jgi:phage repressor protein C with HTH and peptisase S24 domain